MIPPRGLFWIVLAVSAGCASPPPDYPPNLSFAPRTDRLVIKLPERLAPGVSEPGRLDDELAGLDALGGRTFDPLAVPPTPRQALDQFLRETFGTPAAPAIRGEDAITAAAGRLGLTPERLLEGGRLYRRHCLQCHALNGDGRGPTGLWVYPHPRDFRRGSFKFTSKGDSAKPGRADLVRTLTDGLKGTAMPSFGLLPEGQRDLLADYVTFLALRGQVEFQTLAAIANGSEEVDGTVNDFARERLSVTLGEWLRVQEPAPTVAAPAGFDSRESIEHLDAVRRGFELFAKPTGAGCIGCHEDFGRKAAYRFDVWGTVVRPADLTTNAYKGGNRPEDLFRRIRGGIVASGMPAHPSLTDSQVWDLVRFVRSAPYPRELPPDVREKVEAKP